MKWKKKITFSGIFSGVKWSVQTAYRLVGLQCADKAGVVLLVAPVGLLCGAILEIQPGIEGCCCVHRISPVRAVPGSWRASCQQWSGSGAPRRLAVVLGTQTHWPHGLPGFLRPRLEDGFHQDLCPAKPGVTGYEAILACGSFLRSELFNLNVVMGRS